MSDQTVEEAEAAEGAEAENAEAAPSKFGRKKLILFVGAPLLVLLLVGAGLYFSGMLNSLIGGGDKTQAQAQQKEKEKEAAKQQAVFYDLPELLVNLNGNGKKASFLKMSISLELENQLDVAKLQSVMPRIIDNFQVYLRELRIEDLKGSAGMYRLREELLLRVNAAAAPAKITDVLFKEMLVQ
jgi:flagellar FliL protein